MLSRNIPVQIIMEVISKNTEMVHIIITGFIINVVEKMKTNSHVVLIVN